MVRHYDSEQEAYATRHQLWEQRLQRERDNPTPPGVVPLEDRYMFDLQGFFVVRGAVGADDLAEMNAVIDAADTDGGVQLGLTPEEARVMMADPHCPIGKQAQQGFGNSPCGGIGSHPVFDRLIGHPGFTPHVKEFVNGERTKMTGGGGVMQRWPGQASGIHHGGPRRWPINDPAQNHRHLFNFDEEKGTFLCRSVNIMIALNECPEHGGGTAIVPGSHKSNIQHPFQEDEEGHPQALFYTNEMYPRRHGKSVREGGYMDGVPGAIEVTQQAGDVLIFVDSVVHGSTVRQIPGARRNILISFGPDEKNAWRAPPDVFKRLPPAARELIAAEPAELEPMAQAKL